MVLLPQSPTVTAPSKGSLLVESSILCFQKFIVVIKTIYKFLSDLRNVVTFIQENIATSKRV